MRVFSGFLMHDVAGLAVTVSGMTPNLIKRFIAWRSVAHSYAVPWKGKHYTHTSKGIKGEIIQRNIEDISAALNHAAHIGRIPYEIGLAPCRASVCQYVSISVVAVSLKYKITTRHTTIC